MFRSSLSFLFFLAVLAFVAGFAVTIRYGGEPGESEKLDMANEAISGLTAQNEQLREKVQYLASQLEKIAEHQSETQELSQRRWKNLEEFAGSNKAELAEIAESQADLGKELKHLAEEQKRLAERSEEKLNVLAERFDFGDARMREIAAAQEDFAKLGEKIRTSTAFKKVGTVDLADIGRALSERIEKAMKKRRELTDEQKQKLNLLKKRRSQLQQLFYDYDPTNLASAGRPQKKTLDEAEQLLSETYRKEIAELESEVGGLEINTPSSFDGSDRALQLVLAKAEEEYTVVFNQGFHGRDQRVLYHDPEVSVVDLTSRIIQMIRQLPDDDPILSDF